MINNTPRFNPPVSLGRDHDLEAGLGLHALSGSEGSVTSPLSDAPSLASTMTGLVEGGRSSRHQVGRARPGSGAPRSNTLSVTGPRSASARPVSPAPARAVARPNLGSTVREQNPRTLPSPEGVVGYAIKSSFGPLLWIAPSVGVTVGMTMFGMTTGASAAIGFGLTCGLLALLVSVIAIKSWLSGISRFAAGQLARPTMIDLDRLKLSKEIKFWLAQMGRPERVLRWQCETTLDTQRFAAFLGKLEQSRDFHNRLTRPVVLERVSNLLEAMTLSRTVRQRVFEIAAEHCETCTDRVALGLNHMEMVIQNHRAEKGLLSEDELLKLGRGMFRMDMVETFAREKKMIGMPKPEDGEEPDDVEVLLNLQARLRTALDLPVASFNPDAGSGEVGMMRVRQARKFVQSREAEDLTPAAQQYQEALGVLRDRRAAALPRPNWPALPMFLVEQYRPWAAHVERKHPQLVATHQERVRDYQTQLDAHFARSRRSSSAYGGLSHDELSRRAMFYYLHGAAFEKALEKLSTPAQPPQAAAAAGTLEMV